MNKFNNNKNNISRRKFLSWISATPLITKSLLAQEMSIDTNKKILINNDSLRIDTENFQNNLVINQINTENDLIIPTSIKEGDTVAFTAPASPISPSKITSYVNFFKSKGCKIIIGDTIRKQKNEHRYFAAPDKERANELNEMFADTQIKAIICGRGGYGVMRILPNLNYESLKLNPKIIMGYSDITVLLLAIYKHCKMVTYHGPVASSQLSETHKKNILNAFFDNKNSNCKENNAEKQNKSQLKYSIPEMKTIKKGIAKGKLQGGNLTLIAATMGTPYEIDLTNSILFIEDTSILPHEFDRMMTQLLISRKMETCRGIIIGKMRKMDKRGNFFPNKSYTILEIIEQLIAPLNIPCVYNLPFGHIESQLILPYGLLAEINSEEKYLQIESPLTV